LYIIYIVYFLANKIIVVVIVVVVVAAAIRTECIHIVMAIAEICLSVCLFVKKCIYCG